MSAVWLPVKDFEIRPEIVYIKADHLDGTVSGFLRFTRYFRTYHGTVHFPSGKAVKLSWSRYRFS